MHVFKHMVWQDADTLKYVEKRIDEMLYFNDNRQIIKSCSVPTEKTDTVFAYWEYSEDGDLLSVKPDKGIGKYHFINCYKHENGKLKEDSLIYYIGKRKKSIITYYEYYMDSSEQFTLDTLGAKESRYVFVYDDKDNVIQRKWYVHSKLAFNQHFEYDMFNNVVECKSYKGDVVDDVYTYEYEYDEHHNFTKRTEYKNKNIYSITEREIEYQ